MTTTDLFPVPKRIAPKPKSKSKQAQLGQFMTSSTVADFMAGMFGPAFPASTVLLDAGAGRAALTMAFLRRWGTSAAGDLSSFAYEVDEAILPELRASLSASGGGGVTTNLVEGDFIEKAVEMIRFGNGPRFTHAILNPPYGKIGTTSRHRAFLSSVGVETVNLYSGFVALALRLMKPGGEIVAIIPRSFCNGPYYRPFRKILLEEASIERIHLFGSRSKAFKKDAVLQENVIVRLVKGGGQGDVLVSTSDDDGLHDYAERTYPFETIVSPDDAEAFIHVPTQDDEGRPQADAFGHTLDDLGLKVSTGPVVDFRVRDHLLDEPEEGAAPLFYPGHFGRDGMIWPRANFKKPNAILVNDETRKWLYPTGHYAIVKRFSSKEERRRITAYVVSPDLLPDVGIGFENHVNVLHRMRHPLDEMTARGMATYLNSTRVDRYFRRFNGHTQVNATDLKNMTYPDLDTLRMLGRWSVANPAPTQEQVDAAVDAMA